jgi:hypothetical protein
VIDPVTAYTGAVLAYKTVTKLVQAGRELGEVTGQLSEWYGCVADLQKAGELKKSPSLFEKASQGAETIEKQALDIVIRQKEMLEKEKELKFLLDYRFGPGTHQKVLDLRRQINKERVETVYRQMVSKRALVNNIAITVLSVGIIGVIGTGSYFVGVGAGAW